MGVTEGETYFYFPLGHERNIEAAITTLTHHCQACGLVLTLLNVSRGMIDCLSNLGMLERFRQIDQRDTYDYIYKREKLVLLSGKKLHGKKNHLNAFNTSYDSHLVPIDETNIGLCERMLKSEITQRSTRPHAELNATFMALRYREELGLVAQALFADTHLAGVIMAEQHHEFVLVQIAKTDVSFRGASVALFQKFLANNFTQCEYANLMEDLGLDGLRRAKLSYDPDELIDKCLLVLTP
jgi:hypothetical protein